MYVHIYKPMYEYVNSKIFLTEVRKLSNDKNIRKPNVTQIILLMNV